MEIKKHELNGTPAAELISPDILVQDAEQALELLMNLYYQQFDAVILYEKNIIPGFFDLKTGLAGEILQKVSNYRMRLVVVGDFSKYPGQSIKDFIYESNKHRQVNFVASLEQAKTRLSGN